MSIRISAESTIDLPKEELAKYKISTIPFTLVMGEEEGKDGEVLGEDLFAYTERTGQLARTAAVNREEYKVYFEKLLKEADEVVHITLSSGISAAHSNAVAAAEEFEGKVHVIDSLSLSTGIALLAIYASRLNEAGYSAKEIVELVEARRATNQTSFALESVNYLHKGGRCSAVKNFVVSSLGLRPRILVTNGKMAPSKIFRGSMRNWVAKYTETTLEQFNNPDREYVFVTFSSCDDDIVESVIARLKEYGFRNVIPTHAGATICCHCGPHCLGVLYLNDGEHPIVSK